MDFCGPCKVKIISAFEPGSPGYDALLTLYTAFTACHAYPWALSVGLTWQVVHPTFKLYAENYKDSVFCEISGDTNNETKV
jgi:hypothetical protein